MEDANKIDFSMSDEEFQKLLDELASIIMEIDEVDSTINCPMCA
ncbi:hypothetical protein SPSIL_024660 [Sporomusa silvacetica DSM 10669]|uniref:Uncharacterized protein n=1 Tax=Sporomusa silvacetica DSM 10669 TaxID=1123289 RepID=A0ABZ3IL21_9FIRM|nr:hypothetical protein [Sporomusa silvacetica]OZC22744.1 hypothetical protein SPSIL_04880 [Sporomusa silvacetica DSM 10669]